MDTWTNGKTVGYYLGAMMIMIGVLSRCSRVHCIGDSTITEIVNNGNKSDIFESRLHLLVSQVNKSQNDYNNISTIIDNDDSIIHANKSQRRTRDVGCNMADYRKSVCPWRRGFYTDTSLVVEQVQIFECARHSPPEVGTTLTCQTIRAEMSFKLKDCRGDVDDCHARILLPVGCYAAYPCIEPQARRGRGRRGRGRPTSRSQ